MATEQSPCETKPRGHSGDADCARSGWPVSPGRVCWSCSQPQPDEQATLRRPNGQLDKEETAQGAQG